MISDLPIAQPVDSEDLAYLVLTAKRFYFLLDIWQAATGDPPPLIVRQLDDLIAARVIPGAVTEQYVDGWPQSIVTALRAGYDGAVAAGEGG